MISSKAFGNSSGVTLNIQRGLLIRLFVYEMLAMVPLLLMTIPVEVRCRFSLSLFQHIFLINVRYTTMKFEMQVTGIPQRVSLTVD